MLASAAVVAAIALAGCQLDGTLPTNSKAMAPLSPKIVAEMTAKNMDKESPILVRIFKEESELEVWKQDRDGRFALLKTFPICRWSGELGPKIREGDRQTPEGFYTITPTQMNPHSAYYLSFDLGYPNAFDRSLGRTGAQLMVHGDCSSRGCYSMTDEQISEIYALGREAFFGGQKAFQVQAYPFRMTPENLAKHRNNPNMAFWKMIKVGSDHFEVTRHEPKVNVCEKQYVFDAQAPGGDPNKRLSFSPAAKCPVYEVPADIETAVQEKQRSDELQTAELVRRGTPTVPVKTYADGGMHPIFAAAVKRNELGMGPNLLTMGPIPGTIPPTVRPPHTAEFGETPDGPVAAVTPTNEQPVGAVTAQPAADQPAASTATSGTLLTGLFSKSTDTVARFIGLRSADDKPAPPATKTRPKPKLAARTHTPTHVVRAKTPEPKAAPRKTTANKTTANKTAANKTAAPPAPPAITAPVTPVAAPANPPPSHNTLAGATPTVPTGNFENRWQVFR
jgi:murein L,D-transpeptidase YafK